MNKYFVFSLIVLTTMVCSCINSNKSSSSNITEQQKVTKDTLYNDNIQGVFLGLSLVQVRKRLLKIWKVMGLFSIGMRVQMSYYIFFRLKALGLVLVIFHGRC